MSRNATHFLYNESLPKVDTSVCHLPLATLRLCQKQTPKEAENQKGEDKHLCLESQGEGYVAFRISAVRMFNDCFLFSRGISHFRQHRTKGSHGWFSQLKFLGLA